MVRRKEILLIEDNPADAYLVREILESKDCGISVVNEGSEAMDFLLHKGKYESAIRPDLVLLDLNLPGTDGREVLSEIRKSAVLRLLPVVVLSTSSSPLDISQSYSLGANAFVSKPLELSQLQSAMESVAKFWLNTASLCESA